MIAHARQLTATDRSDCDLDNKLHMYNSNIDAIIMEIDEMRENYRILIRNNKRF